MILRSDIINKIKNKPQVTVLIIGAGVNGAGLFRELALQGIDALIIDKSDFSAGASSASSRMIHGGLRYLENREVSLVKESLRERNLLLQNAPHYVKTLPTTIPVFSWMAGFVQAIPKFFGFKGKPTNRGALIIKLGLTMYDFFTRKHRILPTHQFNNKKQALQKRPKLHPGIVCTATYFDAWISYPERLCLELIMDAETVSKNSMALNYCSLQKQEREKVWMKDETTGESFSIKPRIVVNATGAWVDFTNQSFNHATALMGGTKGSHLVLDNPELTEAMQEQMIYYENVDGRICIMFPLHGKMLAGSTDIKIQNPEHAFCDANEVKYILESIRKVFPSIPVLESQIVYRFCGVRPLAHAEAGSTSEISRDHFIHTILPDAIKPFFLYSLIGGKWTTFRSFAEEAAEKILQQLDKKKTISSENIPIGGGKDFPLTNEEKERWITGIQTGVDRKRIAVLLDRYGTQAKDYLSFISTKPDMYLVCAPMYSRNEIEYMLLHEHVIHLDDLVLRRTILALTGQMNIELLKELAAIMAPIKLWTSNETEDETGRTTAILKNKHGIKLLHNHKINKDVPFSKSEA